MRAPCLSRDKRDGRAQSLRDALGASMQTELRCPGTMHARLVGDTLEFKCRRRSCGYQRGVVVIHAFSIHTGELVETRRFADPKIEVNNAPRQHTAVRSA